MCLCKNCLQTQYIYLQPIFIMHFFYQIFQNINKNAKRHSKPSDIAKTFFENGIERGCFYVVKVDDGIGKSLNTKFFKKQLKFINQKPGSSQKGPIKQGLSILPSKCPGIFLLIVSLTFSKFWHGARNPNEVVHERAGFSRKCSFAPEMGKMGQKQGFFEFIGKLSHYFFLNKVYKEILYLLYSCTNPILGKILLPEIWAKMLSTNQIAVFLS